MKSKELTWKLPKDKQVTSNIYHQCIISVEIIVSLSFSFLNFMTLFQTWACLTPQTTQTWPLMTPSWPPMTSTLWRSTQRFIQTAPTSVQTVARASRASSSSHSTVWCTLGYASTSAHSVIRASSSFVTYSNTLEFTQVTEKLTKLVATWLLYNFSCI